jgi:hypothetical protein
MTMKQMRMRTLVGRLSLAAVVVGTASCGDVVRTGRAPVFLVVSSVAGGEESTAFLLSDVIRNRTSPAPCSATAPCPTVVNDPGTASLAVNMKDFSVTPAPNNNNAVTINRYRVEYRRSDGRNTPGVDVPFPIEGGATATIPANSVGSVGFELVRHTSKEETPLVELINNSAIISTTAYVTFFGTDQVGNDISATGTILVNFGNFGDQ